mgnify:CR=1 FL=1
MEDVQAIFEEISENVVFKEKLKNKEKNMNENFKNMERRVFDSLYNTNLEKINYELSKIDEPTLISGVGGSSVVSEFATKIL